MLRHHFDSQRELSFVHTFKPNSFNRMDRYQSQLDRRQDESERQDCNFCAQVLKIHRVIARETPTGFDLHRTLPVSSACPHIQRVLEHLRRQGWSTDKDSPKDIIFYLQGGGRVNWGGPSVQKEPLMTVVRGDRPEQSGASVIVDPEWVDLTTVRLWIDHCVDDHGDMCAQPSWFAFMKPACPEWLIDITLGCVVPWPTTKDPKYVTLSYTWGQTKTLKLTKDRVEELSRPGALRTGPLADQIPNTIRNAVEITRLLGERYIWVDSLCIVQNDEVSLDRNIGIMPMIYARSFFCIMAEGGEDAEHGLRGIRDISAPRDAGQTVFDLDGGEKLTLNPEADTRDYDVQSLCYHQRTWTFQEWLFSRRKLVFGPGPVRWLCQCREWREDMVLDNDPEMQIAMSDPMGMLLQKTFSRVPTLSALWDVISQFNERDLTFPQDAPKAFSGIQALLHQIWPGGLLFGLPELYFEVAICWCPVSTERGLGTARRRARAGMNGQAIVESLPSWSWIGWHGRITFFTEGSLIYQSKYGSSITEPLTKWFTMNTPTSNERRPINSSWFEFRKRYGGQGGDGTPPPPGWARDSKSLYYTHQSRPGFGLEYPLPVADHETEVQSNPQTQFLFCQTSRLYFPIHRDTRLAERDGCLDILSEELDTIISLAISDPADVNQLRNKVAKEVAVRIEMVAVCKGWVKMNLHSPRTGAPELFGRFGRPPMTKTRDGYFVLWIEWSNGVAYRKGVGRVVKEVWEDLKEDNLVDLILG